MKRAPRREVESEKMGRSYGTALLLRSRTKGCVVQKHPMGGE